MKPASLLPFTLLLLLGCQASKPNPLVGIWVLNEGRVVDGVTISRSNNLHAFCLEFRADGTYRRVIYTKSPARERYVIWRGTWKREQNRLITTSAQSEIITIYGTPSPPPAPSGEEASSIEFPDSNTLRISNFLEQVDETYRRANAYPPILDPSVINKIWQPPSESTDLPQK